MRAAPHIVVAVAATILRGLLATLCSIASPEARALSLQEKLANDQTFWVPKDDPDMAAAMRKARESLPAFLALARSPRPSTTAFAVKVGIRDKAVVEYFWISPFVAKDGRYSGTIDNDPDTVKTIKLGDTISFDEREIVDWLYLDGGRLKGNFTMCVMLKRSPRAEAEEVMSKYGLECDF
jgi:uncharacterized protein YegJ (DUF2314 family)